MTYLNSINAIFRYGTKKYIYITIVTIALLILDLSLSKISDTIPDDLNNQTGVIIFTVVLSFSSIMQLYLYTIVKNLYSQSIYKFTNNRRLSLLTDLSIYSIVVINFIIILTILLSSYYSIFLMMVSIGISYCLSIIMFISLSLAFWNYFRSNKSYFLILIYSIGILFIAASLVFTLIYFESKLLDKSTTNGIGIDKIISFGITGDSPTYSLRANFSSPNLPTSDNVDEKNQLYNFVYLTRDLKNHSIDVYFVLLWIATSFLLMYNINRIGRIRYWIIVCLPLLYYFLSFIPVIDILLGTENYNEDRDYILPILLGTYSILLIGLYASLGFRSMYKSIKFDHAVKDYLIITAFGFYLFFSTNEASVHQTYFPPFGLANVSFMVLATYFLATGLSYSVFTVSKDIVFRKYIKKLVTKELELLGKLSDTQMQNDRLKMVERIFDDNSTELNDYKQKLSSSVSTEEIKDYINQVILEEKQKI